MKLPVPAEIRCGSHVYRVVCDAEQTQRLADENWDGDVNHRTETACINQQRPPTKRTVALLHESLHIADKVFRGGSEPLGEERATCLAEGLAQVLQGWGIEFDWEGMKEGQDAEKN